MNSTNRRLSHGNNNEWGFFVDEEEEESENGSEAEAEAEAAISESTSSCFSGQITHNHIHKASSANAPVRAFSQPHRYLTAPYLTAP